MILDEIVSIKKVGVRKTVDIEVDGDHLFYCNGILTHNSAAGDTNDVTEENIQGGISKIQAADNVIGFIPNAQARQTGVMRAKFLKTRDSGGVGSYVDFKTDWPTLSFNPWHSEDGGGAANWQQNAHSNLPSQTGSNQTFQKQEKPVLKKKPMAEVKSDDEDSDDGEESKGAAGVIRGIKGKSNRPGAKKIKLV
jgi:hypothetical protein